MRSACLKRGRISERNSLHDCERTYTSICKQSQNVCFPSSAERTTLVQELMHPQNSETIMSSSCRWWTPNVVRNKLRLLIYPFTQVLSPGVQSPTAHYPAITSFSGANLKTAPSKSSVILGCLLRHNSSLDFPCMKLSVSAHSALWPGDLTNVNVFNCSKIWRWKRCLGLLIGSSINHPLSLLALIILHCMDCCLWLSFLFIIFLLSFLSFPLFPLLFFILYFLLFFFFP